LKDFSALGDQARNIFVNWDAMQKNFPIFGIQIGKMWDKRKNDHNSKTITTIRNNFFTFG